MTAEELLNGYRSLAEDMGGVTAIGQPMVILEDWPEKGAEERVMVYVSLEGDVYSEAITLTIAEIDGELRISSVAWGRP